MAECGLCRGQGCVEGIEADCCGHPQSSGECCGIPIPVLVQEQCGYCGGSGQIKASVRAKCSCEDSYGDDPECDLHGLESVYHARKVADWEPWQQEQAESKRQEAEQREME